VNFVIRQAALVCIAAACLTAPAATWQAARLTAEQQREFLLTAKIVQSRPVGRGVTGSLRFTLSDGVTTHDGGFQSIDTRPSAEDRRLGRRRAGELNFVDSYKYNLAAYDIARLLALDDMMPVTVERRWQGKDGSLTWWVDDVLMDETERYKTNTQPPVAMEFQRQRMRMMVFAELVGDVDRNQGNVLYTKDWRVVMIDFTRAFRLHRSPREPKILTTIQRSLWERIQALTRDELLRATGSHLTSEESAAVMERKTAIVDHYNRLISERGERAVLY
jgi:hypothetical protein